VFFLNVTLARNSVAPWKSWDRNMLERF